MFCYPSIHCRPESFTASNSARYSSFASITAVILEWNGPNCGQAIKYMVYVESYLLGKRPTVPELVSHVSLHIPRLSPASRVHFVWAAHLPANLVSISSVRMAGSECHSSESVLLGTGLCDSSCNVLQVTANTAASPALGGSWLPRLPASLLET